MKVDDEEASPGWPDEEIPEALNVTAQTIKGSRFASENSALKKFDFYIHLL
ncbi:hypothetical protein ACFL03_13945 [Thermodesulfobacteriota bacterium]